MTSSCSPAAAAAARTSAVPTSRSGAATATLSSTVVRNTPHMERDTRPTRLRSGRSPSCRKLNAAHSQPLLLLELMPVLASAVAVAAAVLVVAAVAGAAASAPAAPSWGRGGGWRCSSRSIGVGPISAAAAEGRAAAGSWKARVPL